MRTLSREADRQLHGFQAPQKLLQALVLMTVGLITSLACSSGTVATPPVDPTPFTPAASSTSGLSTPTPLPEDSPEPTATEAAPTPAPTSTTVPTATATVPPTRTTDIEVETLMNELLGGRTTAFTDSPDAFEIPALNLDNFENFAFWRGDALFTFDWVVAPGAETENDGLGPLFNARSCSSCHVRDGKGLPPADDDDPARGLLMRLSIPGESGQGSSTGVMLDDPNYGNQIQDRAITGVMPEGRIKIAQVEVPGQFSDGTPYTLLKPVYSIDELAYGPLHADIEMSPRVAPAIIGLGLLEAIPDDVLLANADPDDADGDGISGRVNMVPDLKTGETVIGRFGWKAGEPTVEQQIASAFISDMGITSPLYPLENCTEVQEECRSAVSGGQPEILEDDFADLTLYSRTLAVPAMREFLNPPVRKGAELFLSSGCSSCHIPSYTTGEHDIEAMENQVIFPYTDLLLHDMGPGLADDRPEFDATGQEWRTPPLWGIGKIETVNGHTRYLHDGRARNLTEAILWHGGEASDSAAIFRSLSEEDRNNLLSFLNAL